jgi:signal transduction histidine kinase
MRSCRVWQQIAGLAAVYFGLAWLGIQVATVGDQVTLLWAPAGVGLAAVLILGYQVAPGLALGLLALSVSTGSPWQFAVPVALGNSLAAVGAAWLVRSASGSDGRLRTPRDAFALVTCGAGLGASMSATVGASAMAVSGLIPWAYWGSTWAEWWIGDAMGILVVAPPLLAWSSRPTWRGIPSSAEVLAVVGILLTVGLLVFLQEPGRASYPFAFTLLPITIWAAYRFETLGAALSTLLVAAIAIAGTLAGGGPFARASLSGSMRLMWGFVGMVAATGLALGSVVAVRARAERALRESRDLLEREIRERERIEEGLRRSERLASLGTFAAGLAHEINNPLGAILLAAHSARADIGDPDKLSRTLEDIIAETERSADIVRSVLKFSKAEIAEFTDLDLREPLSRAYDHTRQLAAPGEVQITLDPLEEFLSVRGSAVELEQVFSNLLRNAIEASHPGGRIRVRTRCEPGSVRVSIHDHGRGMTKEQQARAFEPFYTTRGGQGGTGLGLSLCHGIVSAHGGALHLESQPGKGTTATVELPHPHRPRSRNGSNPRR